MTAALVLQDAQPVTDPFDVSDLIPAIEQSVSLYGRVFDTLTELLKEQGLDINPGDIKRMATTVSININDRFSLKQYRKGIPLPAQNKIRDYLKRCTAFFIECHNSVSRRMAGKGLTDDEIVDIAISIFIGNSHLVKIA